MLKLKKILLPVDYSQRCLIAAESVRLLAGCCDPHVTVLHVTDDGAQGNAGETGCSSAAEGLIPRVKFQAAVRHELTGLNVTFSELPGDPAETIVRFAEENGMDLIMMPTRGLGAMRRFLLGSVTAKVLHDAGCPVWTGVHMEEEFVTQGRAIIGHVACAVDLGPESGRVLQWAADLATAVNAKLTLVHASTQLEPITGMVHDPEWRTYVREFTQAQLDSLLEKAGVRAETKLVAGEPAKAVTAAVGEAGADVLVVGRTPEGLLGRLRANSYAIICQSPCPVVSV
jgi:nucleotide-binding universal stress UspA family protein